MTIQRKKAQSVTEYAILLGVAIAVFAGMQLYVKRGLNARIKQATDAAVLSGGGAGVNLADGVFDKVDMKGIKQMSKNKDGTYTVAAQDMKGSEMQMALLNQAQYEAYYTESKSDTYSENVERERLQGGKISKEIVSQVSGQAAGSYTAQKIYNSTAAADDQWGQGN